MTASVAINITMKECMEGGKHVMRFVQNKLAFYLATSR